jgi:hypothetical protein
MELTNKDTIITVGVTEVDQYGNLLVTPKGGGDKVKIGSKRAHLHPLFQQGKALILHWEIYNNRPYVSDAKWVEGELPEAREPIEPEPVKDEPKIEKYAPQELGMWWKELGECIRTGQLEKDYPNSHIKIKGHYYKKMSDVTGISFK